MTNQNNAAQAAHIDALQDLRVGVHMDRHNLPDGDAKLAALDAAISLLRAPVANSVQWPTMPPSKGQSHVLFDDGFAEGWAKCMDECRRAVSTASAPVAGEAQIRLSPDVLDYLKEGVENATGCEESDVDYDFANELLRLINGPLYAAPQASATDFAKLQSAYVAACDRIGELLAEKQASAENAPVAGETQPASITSRRLSGVLSMDGASLHMKPDGSGQIIVAEEDFTLEDDRSEGPDGPQGGVHWVACLAASEMDALLVYLNGHARPSDDALWDQALTERDEYHDMADKLANAIADHLLVEIGEHSSSNCPWMRALEAIENAAPQAMPDDVRRQVIAECRRVIGSTDGRKEPAAQALAHWVSAKLRAIPQVGAAITHYECGPYNGDGTYEAVPVYAAPLASAGDARRALGGYQTDSFRTLKTHPTPAVAKNDAEARKPVMTLAEFCEEADRIGLTADTLAAQLAARPEFADCLPQAGDGGAGSAKGSEDVALPPLPSPPQHRGHAMFAGSQMLAYARAAVLADRQQRAARTGTDEEGM